MSPRTTLAVAVAMIWAASAQGQDDLDGQPLPAQHGVIVFGAPDAEDRATAEDLEIFSRILHDAVSRLYGDRLTVHAYWMGAADPSMSAQRMRAGEPAVRQPLATRVEGVGAVFQLEAPPPVQPPREPSPADVKDCPYMSKPRWERTRLELSGDIAALDCRECHTKLGAVMTGLYSDFMPLSNGTGPMVDGPGPGVLPRTALPTAPTREQLVDTLIDLLAENGHRLRHLEPDETVAIGITFHEPPAASATESMSSDPNAAYAAGTGMYGSAGVSPSPGGYSPPNVGTSSLSGAGLRGSGSANAGDPGGYGTPGSSGYQPPGTTETPAFRTHEMTGDLAVRQENWEQASEAYIKALVELGALTEAERAAVSSGRHAWKSVPKQRLGDVQRIVRRLINVAVAAGELEGAKNWIELYEAVTSFAPVARSSKGERGPLLPLRMVVRVAKSDLDAVAGGALPPVNFRERVRVSVIDPGVADWPESDLVGRFVDLPQDEELRGRVIAESEEEKLVEVSLGKDDGVVVGQELYVVRQRDEGQPTHTLIATIEVVRVMADRSAARVQTIYEAELEPGDTVVTEVYGSERP